MARIAGAVALAASILLVARAVDPALLRSTFAAARADLGGVALALAAYGTAFCVRALIWTRLLVRLGFGHALAGLHVSLGGNHVLPFRLGEALRVTSVVRRAGVPLAPAAASTVVMRAADVVAVIGLATVLGPRLVDDLLGGWATGVALAGAALWGAGVVWLRRLRARSERELRTSSAAVAAAAVAGWVLESAVMFEAARWAGIELSFADAVPVTAVTIAAQVVAIAPAGLGTYEAAATAALVALGAGAGPALAAAVAAHALKTVYALVAGAIAVFIPTPGEFGRMRLPRARTRSPEQPLDRVGDDVLVFLPAHDEEATVADVVARLPRRVRGRRVRCLVIDDGSTDRTALRARAAGAEVVTIGRNRGLGAAVRAGLAAALERGAAAVAFCDADGEYAPEELAHLVAPILEGRADYVVGSRFAGRIEEMPWLRRIGNRLLTRVLAFVARTQVTDGQSGYRALSPAAAYAAEIIHDFNYAQVLTLDLIDKGFRYAEVPITYRRRRHGRSFVRLGRYVRAVVPAVHRELNAR